MPAGVYRFANAPHDPELAALAFLLGLYRFDRYRADPAERPRLVAPDGVDAARLEAIARAVAFGRDLVNTPANDLGPAALEREARTLAEEFGAAFEATRGDDLLAAQSAADPRRRQGRRRGAAPRRSSLGARGRAEGDAGRQGRRLRQRRPRHQAVERHAADEEGHGRRGRGAGAGAAGHGDRSSTCACACWSRSSRTRSPPRAMRPGDVLRSRKGLTRRDRQHRRRGAAHSRRRAGARRRGGAGAGVRLRHADRRGAGRARPRSAALSTPTTKRSRRRSPRRGARRRSAVAHAAVAALRDDAGEPDRRSRQCRQRRLRRLGGGGAVPRALRRRGQGLGAFRHLRLEPQAARPRAAGRRRAGGARRVRAAGGALPALSAGVGEEFVVGAGGGDQRRDVRVLARGGDEPVARAGPGGDAEAVDFAAPRRRRGDLVERLDHQRDALAARILVEVKRRGRLRTGREAGADQPQARRQRRRQRQARAEALRRAPPDRRRRIRPAGRRARARPTRRPRAARPGGRGAAGRAGRPRRSPPRARRRRRGDGRSARAGAARLGDRRAPRARGFARLAERSRGAVGGSRRFAGASRGVLVRRRRRDRARRAAARRKRRGWRGSAIPTARLRGAARGRPSAAPRNRCAPPGRGNRRHRRGFRRGRRGPSFDDSEMRALRPGAAAASRAAAIWAASRARARTSRSIDDGERQVERFGGFAMGEAGERRPAAAPRAVRAAGCARRPPPSRRRDRWAAFRSSRRPRRRRAGARGGDRGERTGRRRAPARARRSLAGTVDQGQRGLAEQLIDQRGGGDVVEDEPIVAHEGEPKSPQRARVVRPFPDRGHQLGSVIFG